MNKKTRDYSKSFNLNSDVIDCGPRVTSQTPRPTQDTYLRKSITSTFGQA